MGQKGRLMGGPFDGGGGYLQTKNDLNVKTSGVNIPYGRNFSQKENRLGEFVSMKPMRAFKPTSSVPYHHPSEFFRFFKNEGTEMNGLQFYFCI